MAKRKAKIDPRLERVLVQCEQENAAANNGEGGGDFVPRTCAKIRRAVEAGDVAEVGFRCFDLGRMLGIRHVPTQWLDDHFREYGRKVQQRLKGKSAAEKRAKERREEYARLVKSDTKDPVGEAATAMKCSRRTINRSLSGT